ncbi:MAG: hypothetical protein LUQ50_04025 [Methanospirillum sp.]|uniref:hypothetical protein n=1 Tax=Methanospirillum sp. TaxID=45200 RepID=UPI00236D266D|nr:hypothetical protein [Methanospirillum sp.]MDD1728223.1 hypothetical protein [Methanospirillum sp.]
MLTSRYTGSPESMFDYDIRQIYSLGIEKYSDSLIRGKMSDAFWDIELPQQMTSAVVSSPHFHLYLAAQVKLHDKGFLSRDISVRELIEHRSDLHHIFPREYLKRNGLTKGQYNQVANYVVSQSEINIAIGKKEPKLYFSEIMEQCQGGVKKYGNITTEVELAENIRMNCIPESIRGMTVADYPEFLNQRRILMAQKIKEYFGSL